MSVATTSRLRRSARRSRRTESRCTPPSALGEGRNSADVNVYFSIGNTKHYKRLAGRDDVVLSSLFHFEAPIIHPSTYRNTPEASEHFSRVFSFSTSEALAPFGCGGVELESFRIPEPRREVYEDLWQRQDRGFLAMISQNKRAMLSYNEIYTERLRASVTPHYDVLIASDDPLGTIGAEYVPEVARSSATLASLTIRRPVERALDVGTGNGIQAVLAAKHAHTVVATDISERALASPSSTAR